MSASLARYLKDFGAPPPTLPAIEDQFGAFETDLSDFPEIPEEPPIDLEAERAEAFAKGREEGTRETQKLCDEEKAAILASHEQELAALRKKYEVDLARTMASRIQQVAGAMASTISEQTAKILTPLLDETIVTNAISELAAHIQAAVVEGDVGTITVRGPAPLFKKLKTTLGPDGPVLRHVEAEDIDVAVDIADATLVTRMSAWAASLKKVLE